MSVTDEQKKLLKSTVSIAREHGKQITDKFYSTLFADTSRISKFFQSNQSKNRKATCSTRRDHLAFHRKS